MGYEIAKLATQCISAVYTPLKDLFLYLKNEAEYIEELENNLTKLTTEMIIINSRKKRIDGTLEMSVSKEPTEEYRIFPKQIEVSLKKYNKFITKYQKACGNLQNPMLEPNVSIASSVIDELQDRKPTILTRKFCMLAKLSKDISKLLDYISKVNDGLKLENMITEKKPDAVQVKCADDDIPVQNDYVCDVLRHLCKKDRIGIVGPIGVGKTTVMKKLNNLLEDVSSLPSDLKNLRFEIVIWITYPTKPETEDEVIEAIQDEIMARLKINQEKASSINQNAVIISGALRHRKYLLLIDQVSTPIDLDIVGVHKEHEFGKVVVASRTNNVIYKMTDQKVEIKKLSHDDALNLFQKICGAIPDIRMKFIADGIIKSCGGLPLVIKLVATHLKCKTDESSWNDAKRMLQSNTSVNLLGLAGVGFAYKMAYEGLQEDYLKKCSLYGALFPVEHEIHEDYLTECWMAERFIDIPDTLRADRDHGVTVLNELTDRYLLERCSDKYVKMPQYFRKVALGEKYPSEENSITWASSKNELPNEEIWKTATRMSLIGCESELPESPKSFDISTLLLQWNPKLVALADLFFLHMKNLRVLDLHRTRIKSLPNSISCLVTLICLYLNDCFDLAMLPPEVENLKKLELLDIRRTSIPCLPQEIKSMDCLRCLRVSFVQKRGNRNSKGKEISPCNIISNLKKLEELSIEADVCSESWITIADQIAVELSGLEKLTTLCFNFPSVNSLQKFVKSSKSWNNKSTDWGNNTFRSFKFFIGVGDGHSDINGVLAERQLRFSTGETISSVKEVLKQASAFELLDHSSVETLSELDLKNLGSLKVCVIERCNNLLNIVDNSKTGEMSGDIVQEIVQESANVVLPSLVKLHLLDLKVLKCIWEGSVSPGSLSNLTDLTLCGCPELTEVLTPELAKNFSSLKYLKVDNCSKIVMIIEGDQVNLSDILPKVEIIELVNLPKLQNICGSMEVNWSLLKKIVIKNCRKLRNLPLTPTNAIKLSLIQCEESWWNLLQLLDEVKQHFHPLCNFISLEQSSANGAELEGETSSNMDSPTYNGERRFESTMTSSHQTHDAPAKNEDLSLSKTRFCKSGSSDIPSSEMYSLADPSVQILRSGIEQSAILHSSSIVPASATEQKIQSF